MFCADSIQPVFVENGRMYVTASPKNRLSVSLSSKIPLLLQQLRRRDESRLGPTRPNHRLVMNLRRRAANPVDVANALRRRFERKTPGAAYRCAFSMRS